GYFLKIIENGQMRLFELSTEQISEMYQIISRFINGFDAYHYNDFNSADTDYTLLVSIHSDDPMFPNQGQQYYNWQDAKHIPKGVEFLLEFFNKFNYKG
ncbi:MAG TPA: hypothetical protein VLA74_14505, partial [Nitrososphaeraceae archaeon]|nr:hypothetical protein [Nitrososphaeraceae archaeon]